MSVIHWLAPNFLALRPVIDDALSHVPREHLRQLDSIDMLEHDPKGAALGVWRQDNNGTRIEIYLAPHVSEMGRVPDGVREWALRLFVSHTLFHEVGHHVTRVLNKRAMPRKNVKAGIAVEQWAEDYAFKRLQKWLNAQAVTEADAPLAAAAVRVLRLETHLTLPGTKPAPAASVMQTETEHGGPL